MDQDIQTKIQPNIPPNIPHPRKKYYLPLIIVIAVILAGLLIFFFLRNNKVATPKPVNIKPINNSKSSVNVDLEALGVVRSSLLQKAKFSFPTSTAFSNVEPKNLPSELSALVPGNSIDPLFKTVSYVGGRTGYLFRFTVDQTMSDFFLAQRQGLKNWQIIYSVRANIFAFTELENNKYQVQIQHTLTLSNHDLVIIKVLAK